MRAVRVRAIRVRARAGANLRLEVKVPQLAELRARLGELLYLGCDNQGMDGRITTW